MSDERILIIGAGAAGLMAGRELSRAGKRVVILEAANRIGGRIFDIYDPEVPLPIILGAEFIHGEAELTISLLREAGIRYYPISGLTYRYQNGGLKKSSETLRPYWTEFISKLQEEREDLSLSSFLLKYFPEEKYKPLWDYVIAFVEGYDAADPEKISILALQKEWKKENEVQYRIEGGYQKLISFLEQENLTSGAFILTGKVVTHFNWSKGFVEAVTLGGERYSAEKAIITLPLGVLQIKDGSLGFVNFTPPLPIRMNAVRSMGYGSAIRVVFYFKEAFWKTAESNDAGFIFSQEHIPTWWTQLPSEVPLLSGWLAGPKTEMHNDTPPEELIELALTSLSTIFEQPVKKLRENLLKAYAYNWGTNSFARGAYGYMRVSEPDANLVLGEPVENTLFFAGEATYSGPFAGTVEAALSSGREVVRKVLGKASAKSA